MSTTTTNLFTRVKNLTELVETTIQQGDNDNTELLQRKIVKLLTFFEIPPTEKCDEGFLEVNELKSSILDIGHLEENRAFIKRKLNLMMSKFPNQKKVLTISSLSRNNNNNNNNRSNNSNNNNSKKEEKKNTGGKGGKGLGKDKKKKNEKKEKKYRTSMTLYNLVGKLDSISYDALYTLTSGSTMVEVTVNEMKHVFRYFCRTSDLTEGKNRSRTMDIINKYTPLISTVLYGTNDPTYAWCGKKGCTLLVDKDGKCELANKLGLKAEAKEQNGKKIFRLIAGPVDPTLKNYRNILGENPSDEALIAFIGLAIRLNCFEVDKFNPETEKKYTLKEKAFPCSDADIKDFIGSGFMQDKMAKGKFSLITDEERKKGFRYVRKPISSAHIREYIQSRYLKDQLAELVAPKKPKKPVIKEVKEEEKIQEKKEEEDEEEEDEDVEIVETPKKVIIEPIHRRVEKTLLAMKENEKLLPYPCVCGGGATCIDSPDGICVKSCPCQRCRLRLGRATIGQKIQPKKRTTTPPPPPINEKKQKIGELMQLSFPDTPTVNLPIPPPPPPPPTSHNHYHHHNHLALPLPLPSTPPPPPPLPPAPVTLKKTLCVPDGVTKLESCNDDEPQNCPCVLGFIKNCSNCFCPQMAELQ